ncbi:MAG: hypothetical protein ACJ76J_24110 [Thermoanaerobaculia bacterium]
MKFSDPIVDEVRAAREAIVKACDYDLDKLALVLREHERQSGRKLVRLPPKPAAPLPPARKAS